MAGGRHEAEVFTVETGCDLQGQPCLAEADSSASLYAENIDCQCVPVPGAKVSITLDVNAFGQAPSQSSVTVITASEVDRQTDSFTFNFPGAVSTHAEGINNAGTITDTAGKTHGFFGPLGLFVRYDLNGAAGTFGRGINNAGVVTGSLADNKSVLHGFSAHLCAADVSNSVTLTQGPSPTRIGSKNMCKRS